MIENFKNFDAFSESIQFNASKKRYKKRTLVGALLSIAIIIIALTYFIHLSYLFFSGKIDPKFQSQTFVSNENIDIELSNELIGFDYFSNQGYKYLNQLQDEQNLTYMSFVGIYKFSNGTQTIREKLDIIKCKSPQLKNMNCFDFSKLPQQVLTLDNMNRIISSINLYVYMCNDIDAIKIQSPNNCAEEKKVKELINLSDFYLNIKIRTSQFNTSSQEIQYQYKSQLLVSKSNMVQITDFKIQNQESSVKQGFFLQSEQNFQSPISYVFQSINYNRQQYIQEVGVKYLNFVYLEIDENITYFHIQYPTFTEMLALCNSTVAVMLFACSFCKKLAQKIIRQDIFFILLQNIFSKTYMKLLQDDNQKKNIIQLQAKKNIQAKQVQQDQNDQQEDDQNNEEKMEAESKNDFSIPQFKPKFSQQLMNKMLCQKLDQTLKKQNMEEIIKQPNLVIQPHSDEIDVKIQFSNLTDTKSFHLQSISYQEQTPTQLKFYSYQKNSPLLHSPKSQEKLNKRMISTNRSSIKYKESIIDPATSNQLVDDSLKMVHQKQFTQKLGQKIFQSKQFFQREQFQIILKIKKKNTQEKQINKKQKIIFIKNRLFQKRNDQGIQGLIKKTRKKIEQQIDDSLDFLKFYKEMLFLKKATLVLLSKEQLAAIQLIGLDVNEIDPKNHKIMKDEQGIIVFMLIIQYSLFQKKVKMII